MPISAADIQQAIADGLTRRFSFTQAQPSRRGRWRLGGSWAAGRQGRLPAHGWRVGERSAELTGDEIVSRLEAQVGAARVDATAVKNLPSGSGIAFTSARVGRHRVHDADVVRARRRDPGDATLIQVVCHLDRIRGSWIRNAALWRTITGRRGRWRGDEREPDHPPKLRIRREPQHRAPRGRFDSDSVRRRISRHSRRGGRGIHGMINNTFTFAMIGAGLSGGGAGPV